MNNLKKVKVRELTDVQVLPEERDLVILCYTSTIGTDMHNVKYELMQDKAIFVNIPLTPCKDIYLSEEMLLEMLLTRKYMSIESGEIFDHGYPESRLIPSNHHESCVESFIESVQYEINEKIAEKLQEYANDCRYWRED